MVATDYIRGNSAVTADKSTKASKANPDTENPKSKQFYSMNGAFVSRFHTIRDVINLKGKRPLTQILANSEEEAEAAEAAGIDMINVRWMPDAPNQSMAIRNAAGRTLTTFCMPLTKYVSEAEALRGAFDAMEAGADGIYCCWNIRFIAAVAEAGIPVQGHAGLVPRKSTWTGGLRAVGKTLDEALGIYRYMKALEDVGAWAVESEVIPHRIMAELTKRTSLVTISLGSGSGGDVQYLFAQDILGDGEPPFPRHAKLYRKFYEIRRQMQRERVAAFKEFAEEAKSGQFPGDNLVVNVNDSLVQAFVGSVDERS
jgi:3-methyl-2-oxobutanoate hydroxymethyltransferase